MTVMDDLHASEINFRVISFYDGGFAASIGGDEIEGYQANEKGLADWAAVEAWLIYRALELYPQSESRRSIGRTGPRETQRPEKNLRSGRLEPKAFSLAP